jgi:hypothetical protein
MTDLAKLVVSLEAQTAQFVAELGKAQAKLDAFSGSINNLLGGIAEKVAAAFTVDAITSFVDGVIQNAAALERMSQSTGLAVDQLSALQYAAKQSGVDTEALGVSLRKLNVNISDAAGDATSKSATAFRLLGVSFKDAAGNALGIGQVLPQIADKFANSADGANKTAIAVQLFGRAGEQMIPLLNKGAAGMGELMDAARALGLVIDDTTGKAAEEFETRLTALKGALGGMATSIAKDLLPTLTDLAKAFTSTADKSESMNVAATTISYLFKGLASVFSAVVTDLNMTGSRLAGIAATIVELATGNWKEAASTWSDINSEAERISAEGQAQQSAIWKAGGEEVLSEVTITAKRIKEQLGSMTGGQELEKAIKSIEAAIASLKQRAAGIDISGGLKTSNAAAAEFAVTAGNLAKAVAIAGVQGKVLATQYIEAAKALDLREAQASVAKLTVSLKEQVATFGMSKAQADQYKLSTGATGEALARMGADGLVAKASIEQLDVALENKEAEGSVISLQTQVNKLRQSLGDAGAAAVEFQTRTQKQQYVDTNNTAALANLKINQDATIAQNTYNDANERAQRIEAQLAQTEATINAARAMGTKSDLQSQAEVATARDEALVKLQAIDAEMQQIAKDSGLPVLQQQANAFTASLKTMQSQTETLGKTVNQDLQSSFSSSFASILDGASTVQKALHNFLSSFEKDLADLVAKNLTQQLFGNLFNTGGGASTGWLSAAAGALGFGGAKAGGGAVTAGTAYLVGEEGPELMIPGMSGSIVPNKATIGGKTTVNQNFHFPGQATVTRQTQSQVAAAAAQGLSKASRRNN